MSRDEPRRRDWWLVGCAVFAVAIAVSTAAVVVSDEETALSTFVAPGPPVATPTPSYLLSRSTEAVPRAQPDRGGTPGSARSR